jgi:hypothetical protein
LIAAITDCVESGQLRAMGEFTHEAQLRGWVPRPMQAGARAPTFSSSPSNTGNHRLIREGNMAFVTLFGPFFSTSVLTDYDHAIRFLQSGP